MAQAPVPLGDWPYYSGDLAGTRFSPLTEIDTGIDGRQYVAAVAGETLIAFALREETAR